VLLWTAAFQVVLEAHTKEEKRTRGQIARVTEIKDQEI